MNALTDIGRLAQVLKEQQAGLMGYEAVLSEISSMLAQIAQVSQRPQADAGIADAIRTALAGIKITAPPVNVQVAAPNVTVQAPPMQSQPSTTPKCWTFDVTARDDLGRIRQFKLTPEK